MTPPATAGRPPATAPALRVVRAAPPRPPAPAVFDAGRPSSPPNATFAAESIDGTPLHVRVYEPAVAAGRTLLWVHGAFEHGGRYGHAARFFAARGWRVLVPDLRGHGKSGGVPMHARRFDEYPADLRAVLRAAGTDPGRTAALGNSMGGLAVARLLAGRGAAGDEPAPIAAGALCSPLLRIVTPVPWLTRAAGHAVKLACPTTRFAVPPNPDRPVDSDAAADPLRHDSVTAGWFFAVRRGVRDAWRQADRVAGPLTILQSERDRVVCPQAAGEWAATVASADISHRVLPGASHEVFREPDWRTHAADLHRWFDARVPPASARRAA